MEHYKYNTLAEFLEMSYLSRQDLRDVIEHTTFMLATMSAREFDNIPEEVVQTFSTLANFMLIVNEVE